MPAAGQSRKTCKKGNRTRCSIESNGRRVIQAREHRRDKVNEKTQEQDHDMKPDAPSERHPARKRKERQGEPLPCAIVLSNLPLALVLISIDVIILRLRKTLLLCRRIVEPEPEDQPQEADRTGEDEGHLPAMLVTEMNEAPGNKERGNHGPHIGSRIENARRQGAFTFWEPLGHGLDRGWEVPRFAYSKETPDDHVRCGQASHTGIGNPEEGPDRQGESESDLGADLIDDYTRQNCHRSIEGSEDRRHVRVIGVCPSKTARCRGRAEKFLQITDDLTIEVVERRGEKEKSANNPTIPGHSRGTKGVSDVLGGHVVLGG